MHTNNGYFLWKIEKGSEMNENEVYLVLGVESDFGRTSEKMSV